MSHSQAWGSTQGFSMVELMVALVVALLVSGAVLAMLDPVSGAFQIQPEAADVQQRLRVSADVLYGDLLSAGAGPSTVLAMKAADQLAPAVLPFRVGRRNPDAPGTYAASRVAMWYVNAAASQAVLAAPFASASGTASIAIGPGCLAEDPSCGFRTGMLVGVFGPSGAWDLFSVTGVQGTTIALQHNLRDAPMIYPPVETVIAEVTVRTYFFRDAGSAGIPQLMRYDAAGGGDVPVVDHVATFGLEYFGEADAPAVIPGDGEPDRVTYGPLPPEPDQQRSQYPPGENCTFLRTAGGAVASRLASLAPGPALVPLPAAILTDGPWCPDPTNPNRYDADLFRVRAVAITLTIEAAIDSLRGPAGALFTRPGTARGGRLVPDRRVHLVVSPRVLNLGR